MLIQQNSTHKQLRTKMMFPFGKQDDTFNGYKSIKDMNYQEIQDIKSRISECGTHTQYQGEIIPRKIDNEFTYNEWLNALNTELKNRELQANFFATKIMNLCSNNKRNGLHDLLSTNKDAFIVNRH